MRLLAVETSTLAGGVAILEDDRLRGEYLLDVSATHSERLLPAIDRVLADAGWVPGDLQGLAVAVGPGSFTGLRIGLSVVKGLALALGVPVAAVPTLDAMAAALPFTALPICPVLDARKGEVYCSLYRWEAGETRRLWDYAALSPEALAAQLTEPVIMLGDGARLVPTPYARLAPPHRRVPSPAAVGVLGLGRLSAGESVAADALSPIYLRPSEAELKRRGHPVH